ncbi:hypothetical protein QPI28_004506 [Vibrio parahaemolyticus]|uniref:Uncharacterized protein n=2 Tax=Bacteria TaxID=2 RepID=A0ABQ1TIE4_9GAMM|nr:hypothetical protein [Shewanella carassii]EKL5296866.1 hypothetical protein [Vibrio parahaemolyticus]ELA7176885.1 hypothetical protein [Vibrio parahaemolyticus]ELA7459369.1 hypothetical protein [Vibrio parahaemolyticus]ELA7483331.1 hypothetical protein [Vibrio parahaemolyticus]ELA7905783.1 hypothetical protein [Vibrio parahaemolyticus]
MVEKNKAEVNAEQTKECFIIMPIAEADDRPKGHFKHVYSNIIKPACKTAGYKAVRADEVKQTNLIHLDILKQLIEAPIAICDLSNRNPNVLFELGIRQAFDKPTVLIQEQGTPKIFDIAPLRYLEYCKEMRYHDVLESQKELAEAISATVGADGQQGNVNSIVKLLALNSPAQIPDIENSRELLSLDVMHAEVRQMKSLLENITNVARPSKASFALIEYERLNDEFHRLQNARRLSPEERMDRMHRLIRDIEESMMHCRDAESHNYYHALMDKVHRSI